MSDYSNLDSLILACLKGKLGVPLRLIAAHEVREECERLGEATGREPFRILDGRLQALRKRWKIVFDSQAGWRLSR
jgi:hypothetical protein